MGIYSHFPFIIAPTGPTGPAGSAGVTGTAATVTVGTVTTGEPGSQAAVTNSGTSQNARLDFVIPQGATGSGAGPAEFLNAYSTPAQAGSAGAALIFDRNGAQNGTAVTHANNSANVVLQKPGYYRVSFQTAIGPASGVTFPFSVLLYLSQDGTGVPGASVRHTFHTSADISNVALSQIVAVTTAPSTLNVMGGSGSFLYSDAGISVNQLSGLS